MGRREDLDLEIERLLGEIRKNTTEADRISREPGTRFEDDEVTGVESPRPRPPMQSADFSLHAGPAKLRVAGVPAWQLMLLLALLGCLVTAWAIIGGWKP